MSDPDASSSMPSRVLEKTPGQGAVRFFALCFLLLTLALLSQLGAETKYSSGKSLFAQPRFWPALSLLGMLVFSVFHFLSVRRKSAQSTLAELWIWSRAAEYVVWFMVYVHIVPIIGYLFATLLFTLFLALRQGYRSKKSLLGAVGAGFLVVLLFKSLLKVKIPGGAIYEHLPSTLRSFMIIHF